MSSKDFFPDIPRRRFLLQLGLTGASVAVASHIQAKTEELSPPANDIITPVSVSFTLNGKKKHLSIDPRVTLLDTLREKLKLTGTKKGCDRGQCGVCTVLLNDQRVNACLLLTALCDGATITTIEGLAKDDKLHPMQQAFIDQDAFQCGYCTPGQICSAIGLLNEGHAKTDADIKELMSGNICRCGAYQNIHHAIKQVQG